MTYPLNKINNHIKEYIPTYLSFMKSIRLLKKYNLVDRGRLCHYYTNVLFSKLIENPRYNDSIKGDFYTRNHELHFEVKTRTKEVTYPLLDNNTIYGMKINRNLNNYIIYYLLDEKTLLPFFILLFDTKLTKKMPKTDRTSFTDAFQNGKYKLLYDHNRF